MITDFPMAPARTPPHITTLILLTAVSVLTLNMFLPSMERMARDFEVDYALISVALGGFLAVSAVLQLFLGPISDRIGRRPVMLGGLMVYTLASVGCALSTDIYVFLAFRMLQCGVSAGMVLSRAIVRDTSPPEEAARRLAVMGTAFALAPLLAPVVGGLLDEALGWRSIFWVFAALGLGLTIVTWADLGETNLTPSTSYLAQFRAYPDLVKSGLFWAYCVLLVCSIGGFYVFLGGAPQVGATMFGLTPGWLGVGMGSTSGGFLLGNVFNRVMSKRLGMMRMMVYGRVVALVGPLLAMAVFAFGGGNAVVLFGGALFIGFGNGMTLPGANAGVMSVAPRLAGSASGLAGALTLAGGAASSTLIGALVSGPYGSYILLGALAMMSGIGLCAAIVVGRLEAARGAL
ncbi:multidrug effflux MFS transporter [Rhodobacteraceae bacterium D3-12]|nr:multidrug effflux MFS transporter [Rhodobacteraceae bacterium D3-12]